MSRKQLKLRVFANMVEDLRVLSTCKRMQTACIIIDPDFDLFVTGYNGWPHGFDHQNCDGDPCGFVHAELNACFKLGVMKAFGKQDLICIASHDPCVRCAQSILQQRIITEVYILHTHKCKDGVQLLKDGGINVAYL